MNLFDNTLRDGGNVVGDGFNETFTVEIIQALLEVGIQDIEFGNCKGVGAYDKGATNALSDDVYLNIAKPFMEKGRLGMFLVASLATEDLVKKVAAGGLRVIRVGNDAGNGKESIAAVKMVKREGLTCRYSLMKAYTLPADNLAEEARVLEDAGVDKITIMDSAGTMFPQQVVEYVHALKKKVHIPVGFHGHSNLGLSQANALAAVSAGADEIDCGLLGMARSAGNCATELAVATFQREGMLGNVDLFKLLSYLDRELQPKVYEAYGYSGPVKPIDIVLGYAGCHSKFLSMYRKVATEYNVSLAQLIFAVSAVNKKNPTEQLMIDVARTLS